MSPLSTAETTESDMSLTRGGMSTGVNVSPGTDDDGWNTPPPVELADGSRVELYKDGEALHAAYNAIESARRTICLEIYIFHSDRTGKAFAELLRRRAREGLTVRVIYDSVGSFDTDRALFESMRTAGVHLREFHPVVPWHTRHAWRPFNRDHRKLLVVDDVFAALGGQNLGDEYGSSWVLREPGTDDCWRDTAIGVRGRSVRPLADAFEQMWKYVERGGPMHRAELITIRPQPGQSDKSALDITERSLGVFASAPTPRSGLRPSFRMLLRDARKSIDLTMAYFAPPEDMVTLLCCSAQRGLRVRLMLPGRSDVRLLQIAARAFYDKLMAAGVEIYERQHAVLHAKTLCLDGRISIVGSHNLDYRSIQYNFELSAVIHSRTFGAHMHSLFEHDIGYAKRILSGQWRHRPRRDRLVQWAVMRARHLL